MKAKIPTNNRIFYFEKGILNISILFPNIQIEIRSVGINGNNFDNLLIKFSILIAYRAKIHYMSYTFKFNTNIQTFYIRI